MANNEHLEKLKQGKEIWNNWMKVAYKDLPQIKAYNDLPLRNVQIKNLSLTVADLSGIDLTVFKEFNGYNFKRVKFNNSNLKGVIFTNCQFKKAYFEYTNLEKAKFNKSTFEETNLLDANLNFAIFTSCQLLKSNLGRTSLYNTQFIKTNLNYTSLMWAKLIETNFDNSSLQRCRIYGASIWNIEINETKQLELIITKSKEADISVDNLEIAQFLYLMINNKKIKSIIETLTSKIVLILGRFSVKRKPVLEKIKEQLRRTGYVPVIFDFDKPIDKDYLEPVLLISQMARFVIADFSDSKVVLEEIPKIIDNSSVIIIPIIEKGQREPSTLYNLRINRNSIIKTYHYKSSDKLLSFLEMKLIPKAEKRLHKIQKRRNNFKS